MPRLSTLISRSLNRPFSTLSAITCAILLAGCSALPSAIDSSSQSTTYWRDALESAQKTSTRTVRGKMHFVCSYDSQGFYWRFSHPSGSLYRDNTKVGTLNADWSISAKDGTILKMSILATGPRRNTTDLPDAVFKATSPKNGTFAGIRYIERTNAKGGMPLTKCSASQQSQHLSRPFEADYTFWH